MKGQDKTKDYLKRWVEILQSAGLTDAQIQELIGTISTEIETMRSRIEGMEAHMYERDRRIQHQINEFRKEIDSKLLNKVALQVFLDFQEEVRKQYRTQDLSMRNGD